MTQPAKPKFLTADEVAQLVYSTVRPLVEKVRVLEATALKSAGIYESGVAYCEHDVTTHSGSLWECVRSHTAGESFDFAAWKLIVKKGKDGKDLRKHESR